jgi:hypothetical protein
MSATPPIPPIEPPPAAVIDDREVARRMARGELRRLDSECTTPVDQAAVARLRERITLRRHRGAADARLVCRVGLNKDRVLTVTLSPSAGHVYLNGADGVVALALDGRELLELRAALEKAARELQIVVDKANG